MTLDNCNSCEIKQSCYECKQQLCRPSHLGQDDCCGKFIIVFAKHVKTINGNMCLSCFENNGGIISL